MKNLICKTWNFYTKKGVLKTIRKIKEHVKFKIKRIPENLFLLIIPYNQFGDKIYALREFILSHKRFPSNRLIFNDILFKIKTEELQDPLRIFISDKEFVKIFIKAVVGNKYNIPTFKILRHASEIENYKFPARCCIKSTHASGQFIIRRCNEGINKKEIKKWLETNYYFQNREWNYTLLKPKIIVEPLVFNSDEPKDFKIFCYLGKAKLIQVDINRHHNHKRLYFDRNWSPQDFSIRVGKAELTIKKPANLHTMIAISEKLSALFSFIRVDLYSNGKQCFVGEITNCHGSANEKFIPLVAEERISKKMFY